MPLLDIATPQPSFRNNLFQRVHHVSFISGNQKTARSRYFRLPDKATSIVNPPSFEMCRGRLMIKAVATLEPRCSDMEKDNAQQLGIGSTTNLPATDNESSIQDEKEILRRKRISKANKGKEAWNKGLKHSPETRQKIRERTKIAMHTPKVKMKLLKGIHGQSRETRLKIGAAVRLTWDRRRLNRRMIAHCHLAWLNLIAEAARKGFCGEEELQWDSYKIINEQLEKEFREGIDARKKRNPTPGKRAPKTLEQRRKISEAIAAKWADPAYRDRVYCGIAKHRGKDPETRDPTWGTRKTEPKKTKPLKKREGLYSTKITSPRPKLKTSSTPTYKDPQARYKLEMIKSIRAQRAAADPKISEAVTRANVLIGEAQRAAEALEVAAAKSPMAEASLVETRKLIAEAIRYIKSVETVNTQSAESGSDKDVKAVVAGASEIEQRGVNGVGAVGLSNAEITKFAFSKLGLQDEDEHVLVNGLEHIDVSSGGVGLQQMKKRFEKEVEALTDGHGLRKMPSEKQERQGKGRGRRWVSGRLVEDEEDW